MANITLIEDRLPLRQFDLAAYAPEDRFEAWHAAARDIIDMKIAPEARARVSARIRSWHLGTVAVMETVASARLSERGAAHLAGPSAEFVVLWHYQNGFARGTVGEDSIRLGPGNLHLADMSLPFRVVNSAVRHTSVVIPREALGFDRRRHGNTVTDSADTATGRVMIEALRSLVETLPAARPCEAEMLARGLIGLIQGFMLGGAAAAAGRLTDEAATAWNVSLAQAMRRYIDENLENPYFETAELFRAFGASRATIYRCFAEHGGVARYLWDRRLDRALALLLAGPARRGRVSRVAERLGFFDTSHFSRSFRERFDISPNEAMEADAPAHRPRRTSEIDPRSALPELWWLDQLGAAATPAISGGSRGDQCRRRHETAIPRN